MKNKGLIFTGILLVGLMLFSSCALISTQYKLDREFDKIGINFSDKENILRLETPEMFRFWTRWKPIEYLMTREERKLAKKIRKMENKEQHDFYAEKFIEWFWARRDENSHDDINEFKDDFYNRVIDAEILYGNREGVYARRCSFGRGWRTDLGLMYNLLGTPFDWARYSVRDLKTLMSGTTYDPSFFEAEEIEIWYYEVPLDYYNGGLFQDGVAWVLFEKDGSGYWRFGETVFSLFYGYENYYQYRLTGMTMNYGMYRGELQRFIEAMADYYVYDLNLTFEEMLTK